MRMPAFSFLSYFITTQVKLEKTDSSQYCFQNRKKAKLFGHSIIRIPLLTFKNSIHAHLYLY